MSRSAVTEQTRRCTISASCSLVNTGIGGDAIGFGFIFAQGAQAGKDRNVRFAQNVFEIRLAALDGGETWALAGVGFVIIDAQRPEAVGTIGHELPVHRENAVAGEEKIEVSAGFLGIAGGKSKKFCTAPLP